MFVKCHNLSDEHKQPISIYEEDDGFYWRFTLDDNKTYGPYETIDDCIYVAEKFAGAGAVE